MKKWFFIVVFSIISGGLIFLALLYFSPKDVLPKNPTLPLVAAEYPTKVVYNISARDELAFMSDCKKRKGTFNNCGSSCEDSASFCAAVCVPVCEFEKTVSYKNDKVGFQINYPENLMQIDLGLENIDVITFSIVGPLQLTNRQQIDGLWLVVKKSPLADTDFESFVKNEMKNFAEPGRITDPLHAATINGLSGYAFTENWLGQYTRYYLQDDQQNVWNIFYTAPDASHRGYADLADRMVQSFTINK